MMSSRSDGRSENTLRPLSCELGSLKNCDGSAIWKSGHTSVLAAVHGPIAPRQVQHESSNSNGGAGALVSVVIKSGNAATTATTTSAYDPEWEAFLTQQLSACVVSENYPRSVISIVLQIVNADGSVLAVALHAAVSALMDAGIEMNWLPTAVTCCCYKDGSGDGDTIRLDPTVEEEQAAQAVLVLVFAPNTNIGGDGNLLGCHTTASMRKSVVQVLNCCTTAARAVPAIQAFWRLAIEKVTRETYALKVSS
jgi:exosome complex component RRP46